MVLLVVVVYVCGLVFGVGCVSLCVCVCVGGV